MKLVMPPASFSICPLPARIQVAGTGEESSNSLRRSVTWPAVGVQIYIYVETLSDTVDM
jgi:hypothetical protein